jgi:ABC-2 type transport system permease protein
MGFAQPLLLLVVFVLGAFLGVELGLLFGMLSKDQTILVAYMKAFGIFLVAPALFIVFPSWPQWIAKLFPTYYIANPIFRVSIYAEGWSELGWQVLALAGFVVAFFIPIVFAVSRSRKSARVGSIAFSS